MKKFIEELKRRNVIKATIAYLVAAWVLLQVFSLLLPILNAPEWVLKTITLILAIGLPIWIIISWIYDITPKGIEKTASESGTELVNQATNKRLNAFIIVSLSIAVIVLALNQTVFSSDPNQEYSIAIMPFENIQVDDNYSWLSPNFTQSVNSYLSKVKKLRVTDSYSTSMYNDTDKTNTEIGDELDVTYIVRASITQLQNKLSIKVELINTNSNKVEWSEQYDEIIAEDPLKLQQEVSQKIVAQLKVVLSPEDKNALKDLLTGNQEASIFFTEGKRTADRRSPKTQDSLVSISANLFQKAIDLDPNFADAHAELAFVMRLMHEDNALFKNSDKFKKIDSLLQRSLEINPNTARAYTTIGMLQMSKYGDLEKAKAYYDKALEIKPNDATTHHYYALYYRDKLDPDYTKELEHLKLAYRLNPFSAPINALLVINLLRNEKIIEAEEFYKKNNHVFADKDALKYQILRAKIKKEVNEKKDWSEAINIYNKEIEIDSTDSNLYRGLAQDYNDVLYDNLNYLENAKRAYELGKLNSENNDQNGYSTNADTYFFALLKNKRYKEVDKLLEDDYFKSLNSSQSLIYLNFYSNYHQGNYDKAQESLDSFIYDKTFKLAKNYAQQNKRIEVDSILNKGSLNASEKAIVFAILKERDSMYLNIEKEKNIENVLSFNGSVEVDPYRKEERYKALLQKHYLPLTEANK